VKYVTIVSVAVLTLWCSPAFAGGSLGAGDVPGAPPGVATTPATIAASGQGADGCEPFEARYRAIPPRPRISAAALLTHGTP
jgi:hypothetical protein